MSFDPNLPQANALISSEELRQQFNGLNDQIGFVTSNLSALDAAMQETAVNPAAIGPVSTVISNPPTQAQVLALAYKINELIGALKRPQA